MPSLRMSENCTEGAEQHRATTRPPDHPREMAHKMANKRASSTAARATSPLGALLPGRRGPSAPAASSTSKAAETAAYIETLPGISAPFNNGFFDPLGLHKGASIPDVATGHYQQLGQGFWEPLLLAIGVCESYRV